MAKTKKPAKVLLRSQKNAIFTTIQGVGFSPSSEFTLSEEILPLGLFKRLIVRNNETEFDFTVTTNPDHTYSVTFAPSSAHRTKERIGHLDWPGVLDSLKSWLALVAEETLKPDLWATVLGDAQLIKLAADHENQPFSLSEQVLVKNALNEIKAHLLKGHNLTEGQTKIIEARFHYMEVAAARLGRKDWMNIFISSLIGIVTTLALGTEGGRDLFSFAGEILKQLLGTVLYLPGPH